MLSSITNKGFAQTMEADLEATIISVSLDKSTGFIYSSRLGTVIEFVNETLVDVLPGDKMLIITPTIISASETTGKPTKISFGGGTTDVIKH